MSESQRSDARRLMPTGLRTAVYAIFGGVWLSGCAWWILHRFFGVPSEFGVIRHPLEPTIGWLHGALAIGTAFLFGWVLARHGSEGWHQHKRRISGGLLTGIVATLSVTGFALFFISDGGWQFDVSRVHDALGLLVTAFAIEHWRAANSRRSSE